MNRPDIEAIRVRCGDWLLVDDDASFIAHARKDVPALLDYIECLEKVVELGLGPEDLKNE